MTERSGALQEDPLFMSYCQIIAKSCGEEPEEDGGEEEAEEESGEPEDFEKSKIHVSKILLTECNCENNVRLTFYD